MRLTAQPTARAAFSVLLGLWSLSPACGDPAPSPAPRPNIVIYLIDTLRPDHLGIYGYGRDTSPHIDAFARDAVVFQNAYAPSSWTRPVTASLLTGLLPRKHGAVTMANRIPEDVDLLAEHLRALSYTTAAFVANPHVIGLWGFDQGFEAFHDLKQGYKTRADVVVDATLAFLKQRAGGKPSFLYLHTLDPHGPYDPPPPFDSRWPTHPGAQVVSPRKLHERTPKEAVAKTVAAYDGEIAFNDVQFGRLCAGLQSEELYRDSFLIVVSDHGEEYLEHGGEGHAHTLYEELLRVPLIIKFPRNAYAGTKVTTAVSLVDVAPTLLSYLGRGVPAEADGIDLASVLAASPPPPAMDRPFFFDLDVDRWHGPFHTITAVSRGRFKLIRRTRPTKTVELYDLVADPRESRDVSAEHPALVRELDSLLDSLPARGREEVEMDEDTRRRLEALGYIK